MASPSNIKRNPNTGKLSFPGQEMPRQTAQRINPKPRHGSGSNATLIAPAGYAFSIDNDGVYLIDDDGAYLIELV